MAHFSYDEHIDGHEPLEVFEAASQVETLPARGPHGFTLGVADDVERFDLGVRVRAGLAASWFPLPYVPGEITVFRPPELVRVDAKTLLGKASLTLSVAADEARGSTNIGCALETDPSRLGKVIEPLLNPLLASILHDYADLYSNNVVQALER
jgi:hypothetical protein